MAYYYVDPSATGNNDGGGDGAAGDPTDSDNLTDAWESLADIVAGTNWTAPMEANSNAKLNTLLNVSVNPTRGIN